MVFSLFKYLAITDSMFNIGNFLTNNYAITLDLTEIERKENISSAFNKSEFFQNVDLQSFRKNKIYFRILEVNLPVILNTFYLFRSNSKAMNIYLHHVEFTKNYENHVTFKF